MQLPWIRVEEQRDRAGALVRIAVSAGTLRVRMIDVLIAGAGPAGAIAATVLARAGARVLVLDRAHFPRPKLCGDTLNPGALAVLERLGLNAATGGSHPLAGMIVTGNDGVRVEGRYDGVSGQAVGPDGRPTAWTPRMRAFFPEYWLSGLQTETLVRDLAPATTFVYGTPHGRHTRARRRHAAAAVGDRDRPRPGRRAAPAGRADVGRQAPHPDQGRAADAARARQQGRERAASVRRSRRGLRAARRRRRNARRARAGDCAVRDLAAADAPRAR